MKPPRFALALFLVLAHASAAWSQCAPGIPGAGNPGCIPPGQPNSPYDQADQGQPIPPAGPAPVWADRWGAIAIDPVSGRAGTVTGRESKSQAEKAALELCAQHGGNNCTLGVTYYNQCAAAAQPDPGGVISTAHAADSPTAERIALEACKAHGKCSVVYSKCSLAERIQ